MYKSSCIKIWLYFIIYIIFRQMKAYICNYKGHWFTIRKIGKQWFNLNSVLSGPELISDTYLSMYLAQLLQEGKILVKYNKKQNYRYNLYFYRLFYFYCYWYTSTMSCR